MTYHKSRAERCLIFFISFSIASIIITSFFSLPVAAEEKDRNIIFGDWVLPGEEFEADGYTFFIGESSDENKIYLSYQDHGRNRSHIMKVNETLETEKFTFILRWKRFDLEQGYGKRDPLTNEEIPSYYIGIISKMPSLSLEKKISDLHPTPYDYVNVSLRVSNDGISVAKDMLYEEIFPEAAEIIPVKNVNAEGNRVFWQGDLEEDIIFEYLIRLRDESKIKLEFDMKYLFGDELFVSEFEPSEIAFDAEIYTQTEVNASWVFLGDSYRYIFFIDNSLDRTQKSRLEIVFPEDCDVSFLRKYSNLTEEQQENISLSFDERYHLAWEGEVPPLERSRFAFSVRPKKILSENISSRYTLRLDDEISERSFEDRIKVWYARPKHRVWINTSKLNSTENVNIVVFLQVQDNGDTKFLKDSLTVLDGNFIESMEVYKRLLMLSSSYQLFNIIYEPRLPVDEEPYLELRTTYQTQFGENMTITDNFTISKEIVRDTRKFLRNTSMEEIFPYDPSQHTMMERLNIFLTGFFAKFTKGDFGRKDNLFVVPLIIIVLIMTLHIVKSWEIKEIEDFFGKIKKRIKRFKR